jgi:hypothetical protein
MATRGVTPEPEDLDRRQKPINAQPSPRGALRRQGRRLGEGAAWPAGDSRLDADYPENGVLIPCRRFARNAEDADERKIVDGNDREHACASSYVFAHARLAIRDDAIDRRPEFSVIERELRRQQTGFCSGDLRLSCNLIGIDHDKLDSALTAEIRSAHPTLGRKDVATSLTLGEAAKDIPQDRVPILRNTLQYRSAKPVRWCRARRLRQRGRRIAGPTPRHFGRGSSAFPVYRRRRQSHCRRSRTPCLR